MLLLDTSDPAHAQATGRINPDHINSTERLRLYAEHGGWTIVRGPGGRFDTITVELGDEEFEDVIGGDAPCAISLTREERRAFDDARWEVVGHQGQVARKQAWGEAA